MAGDLRPSSLSLFNSFPFYSTETGVVVIIVKQRHIYEFMDF